MLTLAHFRHIILCLFILIVSGAAALLSHPNDPPEFSGRPIGQVILDIEDPQEKDQLLALITTHPGEPFSQARIRESMRNLFYLGLFSDIQVETVPRDGTVDIVYHLEANRFIQKIKVRGKRGVSRRQLNRVLDRFRFVRYSEGVEKDIKDQIGDVLKTKGYFLPAIESAVESEPEERFLTLVFHMDHGPRALVEALNLTGDAGLFRDRIRSICEPILPGSPFSEKQYEKVQKRLVKFYQNMNFLLAEVSANAAVFIPDENKVILEMEVVTGPRVIFSYPGSERERKKLLKQIPLRGAGEFSEVLLLEGEENIKQYFVRKGYRDVEVDLTAEEDSEDNVLYLTLRIERNMPAEIGTISIQGNQFISEGEIRKRMNTREKRKIFWFIPGKFVENRLNEDIKAIKALYLVNGYPEAAVRKEIINLPGGGVSIELTIDEGTVTTVEDIQFEGNDVFSDEYLLKLITLREGKKFTEWEFENNRSILQGTYVNEGFRQARVRSVSRREPVPDQERREKVFLTFYIEEGPRTYIHHVITRGNFMTRRKVVERELTFKSGDPLSQGKILESQQNLYERRIFKRVRIFPVNPGDIQDRENLIVELEEGKPLSLNFGIGFDTEEKLRGLFSATHNNLFGHNWVGSIGLKGSAREQRGTFSFQYPYIFERKMDALFSAFAENTKRQGFNSRRIGALFQAVKEIGNMRMVGSYNYEDIYNYDMEIDESELNRWDRTVKIASLGFYLVKDSRDNPVDSSRGILNTFDLQYAADFLSPGSSANFIKFFTQHTYYKMLTRGTVLATALRVGLARGLDEEISLPISERFFAGGGNTIRSLPLDMAGPLDDEGNPLGGNAMLLGNIELRQSILNWLGGAAFIDVGNVFAEVSDISLNDIRYCSGVGLRLKTPVGPVRLDIGFNLDRKEGEGKYEIFLSLGQTF